MDRVLDYIQARSPTVAILPMIQNAAGGKWNGTGLAKMLADPTRAQRVSGRSWPFSTNTNSRA